MCLKLSSCFTLITNTCEMATNTYHYRHRNICATFLAAGKTLIDRRLKHWEIILENISRWHQSARPCRMSYTCWEAMLQPSRRCTGLTSTGFSLHERSWFKLRTAVSLKFNITVIHGSSTVNELFTHVDNSRHFQISSSCNDICYSVRIEAEDSSINKLENYLKSGHADSI